MSEIKLILARSLNNVIGHNNKLPWHVPDDLKSFKEKTMGHSVLMGRKTWDSLPSSVKPLPGRLNVIATRDIGFTKDIMDNWSKDIDRIYTSFDIELSLKYFKELPNTTMWVIGGEQIYKAALPFVDEIHVTEIIEDFIGDAFSFEIKDTEFELIYKSKNKYDSKTNVPYYNCIYKRI